MHKYSGGQGRRHIEVAKCLDAAPVLKKSICGGGGGGDTEIVPSSNKVWQK